MRSAHDVIDSGEQGSQCQHLDALALSFNMFCPWCTSSTLVTYKVLGDTHEERQKGFTERVYFFLPLPLPFFLPPPSRKQALNNSDCS